MYQYRIITKEYTNCCMLHSHLVFTYVATTVVVVNVQECTRTHIKSTPYPVHCKHCIQQYMLLIVCPYHG